MLVQREHISNVAQIGSGVFSMKVYKVCSVLDVRLLFLSDWSFKSECECECDLVAATATRDDWSANRKSFIYFGHREKLWYTW